MKWVTGIVLGAGLAVILWKSGSRSGPPPPPTVRVGQVSTWEGGTAPVERIGQDEEGYVIKRFEDRGEYHYFVTPGPARLVTEHRTWSGRVVRTKVEAVETLPRRRDGKE